MTDDTEALLWRAVGASPDDALPRLVLADWLEENGGTVACGRCVPIGADGRTYSGTDGKRWLLCPTCSGTGRVSDGRAELAAALRATAAYWPMADGVSWWWYRGNLDGSPEQGVITEDLFDALSGSGAGWSRRYHNWLFPTAEAAIRDLCRAYTQAHGTSEVTA